MDPPIEGVDTTTACLLGTAGTGPLDVPVLVAGLADFERAFGPASGSAFLWDAARAFFAEGGRRLAVQRVAGEDAGAVGAGLESSLAAPDVSTVLAPGLAAPAVLAVLVEHAAEHRRFAVLDTPPEATVQDALRVRAGLDSAHAAIYWPWVTIGGRSLPPSAPVAGLYARNDVERGVWKAPAGVDLADAGGVASTASRDELEQLARAGVNPIRPLLSAGVRVWGARTVSSDPEWKYVNVRRYVTFLERSLEEGLSWAVFEPNDEPLWARVRAAAEGFLLAQWRLGAFPAATPHEAFFVRCDRTTMTQDDLDNGRLVAIVGVATVRPAEFVIFRIGLWACPEKP